MTSHQDEFSVITGNRITNGTVIIISLPPPKTLWMSTLHYATTIATERSEGKMGRECTYLGRQGTSGVCVRERERGKCCFAALSVQLQVGTSHFFSEEEPQRSERAHYTRLSLWILRGENMPVKHFGDFKNENFIVKKKFWQG